MAKHWGRLSLVVVSAISGQYWTVNDWNDWTVNAQTVSTRGSEIVTAIAPTQTPSLNQPGLSTNKLANPLPIAQQSENVIFVAPNGTDMTGAGTQAQPFRTITAALSTNPQPGTVIQLAPGTYDAENGEVFPIKLLPGIRLSGNSNAKGQGTIVVGGGKFISPTFASQNIAMLAEHNSIVEGITLINSNPRGYALWVESKRDVVISSNTFSNTTHDGIFLTGDASVSIVNNIFTQNRGSGISAVGTSTGEIRGNTFNNTGFGLSIGQKSQVTLSNNRIINNVDGIIISNVATPVLRGNTITNNNRNGLVILKDREGQPAPDLGTSTDPGRNTIQNNKVKDIHNVSGVAIAAAGNELSRSKLAGPIDTIATRFAVRSSSYTPPKLPSRIISPTYPTPNLQPRLLTRPPLPKPTVFRPAPATLPAPAPVTNPNEPIPTTILIERSLPPVSTGRPPGKVVERPISTVVSQPVTPVTALPPPNNSNSYQGENPTTNRAALRYRVVVPLESTATKDAVRRIVPNAFVSRYQGRPVMQTGAYNDRTTADEQAKILLQSGLQAIVTSMNS
jgi:parallel beta-helix repeat protein